MYPSIVGLKIVTTKSIINDFNSIRLRKQSFSGSRIRLVQHNLGAREMPLLIIHKPPQIHFRYIHAKSNNMNVTKHKIIEPTVR